MIPTTTDVVLFDLGGVLIELRSMAELWAWSDTSLSNEQLHSQWLRSPTVQDYDCGRIEWETFAPKLIAEFKLDIDEPALKRAFESWPKAPFPGALELLQELRTRYKLALLSNINAVHWEPIERLWQISAYFDELFLSYQIGQAKPDKQVFQYVIVSLGCPPERILFFDDNALNVEAAKAVGMRAHQAQGIEEVKQLLQREGVLRTSKT